MDIETKIKVAKIFAETDPIRSLAKDPKLAELLKTIDPINGIPAGIKIK